MRRGFSIIELLVTVGIVSVLLSLALVAVQRARDSAGSIACCNKQRQIGLAVSQHHSLFRTYHTTPKVAEDGDWRGSWNNLPHIRLLPYLELTQLRDEIFQKVAKSLDAPNGETLHLESPGVFLCATDEEFERPKEDCNYVVCFGLGLNRTKEYPAPYGIGGWIRENNPVRVARISSESNVSDGLSNTILYGEKLVDQSGSLDVRRIGTTIFEPTLSVDQLVKLCVRNAKDPYAPRGASRIVSPWYHGRLFVGLTGPNTGVCAQHGRERPPFLSLDEIVSATSQHSGRCNFLFADNSVHTISDTVDIHVYRSQCTAAGGD